MTIKNTEDCYGTVQIAIHWIMALLIFFLFILGKYMMSLDYMDAWYTKAPALHKSIGFIVFSLLVVRAIWRYINTQPTPVEMPEWERITAVTVHRLFYVLILLAAISGYLISTADGRGVEIFNWFEIPALITPIDQQEDIAGVVHNLFVHSIIILAALHAAAALKHHFIEKDRTLVRMLEVTGSKRKTTIKKERS